MTNEYEIFLFELSGEHPELPQAELKTVLLSFLDESNGQFSMQIDKQNRLAYVEIKQCPSGLIQMLQKQLAMVHNIHLVILRDNYFDFPQNLNKLVNLNFSENTTFKIFTRHLKNRRHISKSSENKLRNEIIRYLSKFSKVNIKSPDVELILFFGQDVILTKKILEINRSAFETRKPQYRPYFAPISLHPRLARCMVNLAGISKPGTILDPFCGTGGILIEAGLMGFNTIGADIENKMVDGTEANLKHWGIKNFRLINSDIIDLPKSMDETTKIDAIVTEPPYGRATGLQGRTLESLIEESFNIFHQILGTGEPVVVSLPDENLIKYIGEQFSIMNKFQIRIHKSLTKTIFVLRKI